MIINDKQLRPPTDKERHDRYIELERLTLNWDVDWESPVCATPGKLTGPCGCPKTEGSVNAYGLVSLDILELIEFCKDYTIPCEAKLSSEGNDGELVLDWSHLNQCPVCEGWYREEDDHIRDPLHVAISRAKTAVDAILRAGDGEQDPQPLTTRQIGKTAASEAWIAKQEAAGNTVFRAGEQDTATPHSAPCASGECRLCIRRDCDCSCHDVTHYEPAAVPGTTASGQGTT